MCCCALTLLRACLHDAKTDGFCTENDDIAVQMLNEMQLTHLRKAAKLAAMLADPDAGISASKLSRPACPRPTRPWRSSGLVPASSYRFPPAPTSASASATRFLSRLSSHNFSLVCTCVLRRAYSGRRADSPATNRLQRLPVPLALSRLLVLGSSTKTVACVCVCVFVVLGVYSETQWRISSGCFRRDSANSQGRRRSWEYWPQWPRICARTSGSRDEAAHSDLYSHRDRAGDGAYASCRGPAAQRTREERRDWRKGCGGDGGEPGGCRPAGVTTADGCVSGAGSGLRAICCLCDVR